MDWKGSYSLDIVLGISYNSVLIRKVSKRLAGQTQLIIPVALWNQALLTHLLAMLPKVTEIY